MNIPSQEQIEELWSKYEVSDRLKAHTMAVTKVAVFLAERLKEKGVPVNVDVVRAGALLHDLDKIQTLKNHPIHGKVSQKILEEAGFPEIGRIAWFHSLDHGLMKDLTWEEKLVRYADARCMEGDIVSMEERLEYVDKRYTPPNPEARKIGKEENFAFEKEIFETIGIRPEELGEHLE